MYKYYFYSHSHSNSVQKIAYISHIYYLYVYIYISRNEDDRDQFVMLVQGPTVEVTPLASRKEKAMGWRDESFHVWFPRN